MQQRALDLMIRFSPAIVFLLLLVAAAAAAPPNVVLIVADDLGYRELGCYGQKRIRTPHLDGLAKQGMMFTRAYSGNAVCAPSRCVLLTGKHPGHASIRNNGEVQPEGQRPIDAAELTIAELLADQGYATGAFGKWGLGFPGSAGDPLESGFDRFFGYNCQRHAHSYYPGYLWSDQRRIALNNQPPVPGHAGLPPGADPQDPASYDTFKGADYAPDQINRQVLAFIRANRSRPFLLYYPTIIPHVALHVPDDELRPYLARKWKDPPFTRATGGYTPHFTPRAAYAAMITRMDRYVGNVLRLLDELKLADNTIVVFSSDNGTTHMKQEVDYDFFESVGDLRGLKGSLYEGGIRVPMIVRWPGRVAAGTTSGRIVGFEDVLPTLADVAGAADRVPIDVDGIRFTPTLLGERQTPRPFLYREFSGYGGQQSVHFGKWKAVRQGLNARRDVAGQRKTELYDLHEDPAEENDLADRHPETLEQARQLLRQQHTPSELFPIKALDRPAAPGS